MTEKDLEIQQLRRALAYTEKMYAAQRELNEQLMSISELLAGENKMLMEELARNAKETV